MADDPTPVTVLLADDDERVRKALTRLLERARGHHVVAVCQDGLEAALSAGDHRPDVAVVDLRMPGGGPAGIRRLLEASPSTAVIAYSAHNDPDTRREALDAGAGWFLVKGADDSCLLPTIAGAVARPARPEE